MDPLRADGRAKAKKPKSGLPSIIEALSATHDVETVAGILNCKRKGNSPAIDEPCLLPPPPPFIEPIKDSSGWETALFEHPKVLDRLLMCPSVYEIPWKAAVMAIRHYADHHDDCEHPGDNTSAAAPQQLDLDVSCFLQNVYLVWKTNQQVGRLKNPRQQQASPTSTKSPSKKLRRGETTTATTPAKWLLRMAEAILETTCEGYIRRKKATNATNDAIPRVKDLLSILASVISIASEFDTTLSFELLDRTFIRHLTRPDMVHVVLLHLAARRDVQARMRPADWRGLQRSLRHKAALASVAALPIDDRVEVTSCIVRMAVHCHSLTKTSVSKMLQRWADILILTLNACHGDPLGEEALVATFATLSAVDFILWRDELLGSDTATSSRPPDGVARALVLLARGQAATGQDERGFKVDAFWKKIISISSWGSDESLQLRGVLYAGKGFFKGSDRLSRIGAIVCESIKLPNGDCNIDHGRLWASYSIQALLDVKLRAGLSTEFAAAVIATVFSECRALQKELIGQLMKPAADNADLANAVAAAVSMLGDSLLKHLRSADNHVNLLNLPTSRTMFALLSSTFSRCQMLHSQLYRMGHKNLVTLFARACYLDGCSVDGYPSETIAAEAKRSMLVLVDILENEHWSDVQKKAWNLISGVMITNDPPIPLEARSWLYRTLGERIKAKMSSKKHHIRYCRICLLRALSFFNNAEGRFCFDFAFMKAKDSLIQVEDVAGLFELLLLLFMSIDPLAFNKLRQKIVQNTGKSVGEPLDAGSNRLVSETMLIHFPLMIGRTHDGDLRVEQFVRKLSKEEFQDSVPASISLGPLKHLVDPSEELEKSESIAAVEKRTQFHSLVRLILSDDLLAFDVSQTDTCGGVENRLLAISRCVTDHWPVLQRSPVHPETVSLVLSATVGFCKLLKTSFNQIFGQSSRAADVDTILAALAVVCEVATDVTAPSDPVENYRRLMTSWEVYGLVAEERNARKLVLYLEKFFVGARNICWGIDGNTDDSIRRVRSGVLRLFRSCLRWMVNAPNTLGSSKQNKAIKCIQKAIKRLCKDLLSSQEGQSGGLSHDLYDHYIECISFGLQILDAGVSCYVEEAVPPLDYAAMLSIDDTAISCVSAIQEVVETFPLQKSPCLRKALLVWLWQAPKLSRTLFLSKLQRGFKADEPASLDCSIISMCFDQVFTISLKKLTTVPETSWSLVHELPASQRGQKSASKAHAMLNLSSEKMWESAFAVIMQVVKNHCNESTQRIENLQNGASFASSAAMEKYCTTRTGQLESLLRLVGATLTCREEPCHEPSAAPLVVIELPLMIKTEISYTCDAFLCTLKQALKLLSEETDDILDSDRFAEAAACMISWSNSATTTGDDVLCRILLWESVEQTKASPRKTSESLQRRLKRMSTKVSDLSKMIRRIVANKAEIILIDKLEDLASRTSKKKTGTTSTGFNKMLRAKLKLLETVLSPVATVKQSKKRKRTSTTIERNPIVGKWLDIDREGGRDDSAKDDEFDDLDDFIVEG